jgi:hypothetical protein
MISLVGRDNSFFVNGWLSRPVNKWEQVFELSQLYITIYTTIILDVHLLGFLTTFWKHLFVMRCKEGKIPTQFTPMQLVLSIKPTKIEPISETTSTNANTMGSFKK